ncbi:MAG: preprotein translocase subunit SecE [Planctomycetota bacterium]
METEAELRKVHWPNMSETRTASLVVMTTVLVLGAYLFGADRFLGLVISGLLSLRGS